MRQVIKLAYIAQGVWMITPWSPVFKRNALWCIWNIRCCVRPWGGHAVSGHLLLHATSRSLIIVSMWDMLWNAPPSCMSCKGVESLFIASLLQWIRCIYDYISADQHFMSSLWLVSWPVFIFILNYSKAVIFYLACAYHSWPPFSFTSNGNHRC